MEKLYKSYKDIRVIDDLNFQVKEGEIFGLLGPNGAGKSTSINILLGLINFDQGSVKIFNKDINTEKNAIKSQIGFVPQEIAIFKELNAYDNVAYFGKLYGLKGDVLKEKVKQALEFVGLWERRKDFPDKYSGGMQRRLNIACAIVHEPKLLFMDEPTIGVDPQSRNNILESIKKLNERGTTVVYTSHYMEEIEELCTKVAIIDSGRLIAEGTSEELKEMILKYENISIEIDKDTIVNVSEIKNIDGVVSCEYDEGCLKIKSSIGSGNLSYIIERLIKANYKISSIDVEQPTLEAVFLKLTGKKLRD